MAAGTVMTATAGTSRKPYQQNQLLAGAPNPERKATSKPAESRSGVARGPRFALQLQPRVADGKYLQTEIGAVSFEMSREKLLVPQGDPGRGPSGTGRGKSADRKSHSKTAMARKSNRQDIRGQPQQLLQQNNWCEGGTEELESQTQQ